MGGDRGPDEIVAGALEAASGAIHADPRTARAGLETGGPRARRSRRHDRDAREAGRSGPGEAGQLARRRAAGPWATGDADAVVSAGNTGAMLAAGAVPHPAPPGGRPAGDRRRDSRPGRARRSCSTPARTPTPAPSTCSSSRTWAPSSPRRCSRSPNPDVRLLSIGEEPEKGNQLTLEAHALLASERAQLRRERREPRPPERRRRTSSSATASPATSA